MIAVNGISLRDVRHVSRETLNAPLKLYRLVGGDGRLLRLRGDALKRRERRAKRKLRMALRKRRGWR